MAEEDFTSPAGDGRETGRSEDPWEELLDRVGGSPALGEMPGVEPAHAQREESEYGEEKARSPRAAPLPSRHRLAASPVRIGLAALAVSSALAVGLARVVIPAVSESDSARSVRPPRVARFRHAMPSIEVRRGREVTPRLRARRQERAGLRAPASKRQIPPRIGLPENAGQHTEPGPTLPAPAGLPQGTPSEVSPPRHPGPEPTLGAGEPAPPRAAQPGSRGGLRDGSKSSAEFGL